MVFMLKQRLAVPLLVAFLFAICGALAGWFEARSITQEKTFEQLSQAAAQLSSDIEASRDELRTLLYAIDASPNAFCSDGEIRYLRALIFESEYVRDAGKIRNGRLSCSAALGRIPAAQPLPDADITFQDGSSFYKSLKPYPSSGAPTQILMLQDAYVVFTPQVRMHLPQAPFRFVSSTTDAPSQQPAILLGEAPALTPLPNADGISLQNSTLYATHCSIRYFNCFTTYVPLHAAIQANRGKFLACILIFALGFAVLGFFATLLRERNQSMEQQLRRAIHKDKLRLVYQPIVDLESTTILGAEALIRWTNEAGNPVPPDVFVRLAEEHGFAGEITRLVIRHAMHDMAATLRNHPNFRLSINIAASDLRDAEFLPNLDRALEQNRVSPRQIAIEITEGSTANYRSSIETILQLRRRGFSVHIDDFGTGYSSLAYLHDLSVDAIKIDRAFTQGIGTGSAIVAILPQILSMAESLSLGVIVEGIETRQQAEYFANSNGRILAQGWLFSKPVPPADLRQKLSLQDQLLTPQPALAPQPIQTQSPNPQDLTHPLTQNSKAPTLVA